MVNKYNKYYKNFLSLVLYIMNISKLMKKLETSHVVMIAAALALGYAVYNYSANKSVVTDNMKNGTTTSTTVPAHIANAPQAPGQNSHINTAGNPQPSAPIGENSQPAGVSGATTSSHGLPPACSRQQVVDPSELLPKDQNSEWAKLNPMGSGDLQNVNLLKSGYHIGINTVASSLRNANLQLRSEPANPQTNVGPWNNTTIQPDINRRPMEIGCGTA